MIFHQGLHTAHADLIGKHQIRRTRGFNGGEDVRRQHLDIRLGELVLKVSPQVHACHAIRVSGDDADRLIAQLGIGVLEGVPQRPAEQGLRQLAMRELDGIGPNHRLQGFGGLGDHGENIRQRRTRLTADFLDGIGCLVTQPAVWVVE